MVGGQIVIANSLDGQTYCYGSPAEMKAAFGEDADFHSQEMGNQEVLTLYAPSQALQGVLGGRNYNCTSSSDFRYGPGTTHVCSVAKPFAPSASVYTGVPSASHADESALPADVLPAPSCTPADQGASGTNTDGTCNVEAVEAPAKPVVAAAADKVKSKPEATGVDAGAKPTNDGTTITFPLREGKVDPFEVVSMLQGIPLAKDSKGLALVAGIVKERAEKNGGRITIADVLLEVNNFESRIAQRQQEAAAAAQKENEAEAAPKAAEPKPEAHRPTAQRSHANASRSGHSGGSRAQPAGTVGAAKGSSALL